MPLPPNTIARFQPMDVGIIKSFKAQYRKLFLRRLVDSFDVGLVDEIDIYDAVVMAHIAWTKTVTSSTVKNCWSHTRLTPFNDNRPAREGHKANLNDPLVDLDLNSQVAALEGLL